MKNKFLLLLLIIFNTANAQQLQKFRVVDSTTKEPVPFATINIRNKAVYFEADSSGIFFFTPQKGDSIIISCVGYYDKYFFDFKSENPEIKLAQKPKDLKKIYVGKFKTTQIGILKAKTDYSMASNLGVHSEYATLITIPAEVKSYSIHRIYFKVYTKNARAGNVNPVRIHIYDVNKDGTPGEDLLQNDIVLTSINLGGNYLTVDLPYERTVLDNRSFFISMQWINQQKNIIDYKQPQIAFTRKQENQVTWMRQSNLNSYSWNRFINMGNMIVKTDIYIYE